MPAATIKLLLMPCLLLILAGCSARMESAAAAGKIENYKHADGLQRSMMISWRCRTKGVLASLFSPSGDTGCNDDNGRGEVSLPISPDGSFEIPGFDVKVTKIFSIPSLYFEWEILTENRNGQIDSTLLTGGRIHDDTFFAQLVNDYRSLRHIAIEDSCINANITAVDGMKRFPFDDIKVVYPDSYNLNLRYILTATLKRDGVVITSPRFTLEHDDRRFCANDLGLFVVRGDETAVEELRYLGHFEMSAGVVYSKGPVDPVTGQRAQDYRYVRERTVREGKSPVSSVNQLPAELIGPIDAELDITRPAEPE